MYNTQKITDLIINSPSTSARGDIIIRNKSSPEKKIIENLILWEHAIT